MFSGKVDALMELDVFFLPELCPGGPFSSLAHSLDIVSQCSLLNATHGLYFSKGLSALGLEPHLLLLLHKHQGSGHV